MAIYISGVRNLPEQVQKNKDDIEDLQTADTNLEAKIDQEITDRKALIEASGEATIIKNPTEAVSVALNETLTNKIFSVSIEGSPKLTIDESDIVANEDVAINGGLEAYGNITGHGNIETADGNITTDNGDITTDAGNITTNTGNITTTCGSIETSFGHVKGLALISTIINVPDGNHAIQVNCKDSSNTNHVLQFDADTLKLTIDGNEVGGKQLYQHHMALTMGIANQYLMLDITTDSPTPMTKNDLASYFNTKGYNSQNTAFNMNGYLYINNAYRFVRTLYATNSTTLQGQIYDEVNGNQQVVSCSAVIDQVLPI